MPRRVKVNEALPSPRIVIENVAPEINGGKFPIKRVVGEQVVVRADVYAAGHDEVLAFLLYRECDRQDWRECPMKNLGNDAWIGSFAIKHEKNYYYSVRGYISDSHSASKGRPAYIKKRNIDPKKGVTYALQLQVSVERARALFSSWYEIFPRSWSLVKGKHGTFKDCERILPGIARMGFNVVYLSPIHPIGKAFRKGKNNALKFTPGDPGSPWAVGSEEGGHKSVHPQLGTLKDFRHFVGRAKECALEVALDIAFQCSQDHPYVKSHPEWFKWRPDGTIQYAENPPKKYEDIVPFNFDTADRSGLWKELKSIILFWVDHGVKIFRVDNPHTKPFAFWDWLIAEVKKEDPDVLFLAEAFTRPKIMYRLAKAGFSQSYTYFTWRNTKQEFEEYLAELTRTEAAEIFRPNFWPNTPDILPEHLQRQAPEAFAIRAVMAATLSSNYGIYGPAFELCVNAPIKGREEYLDSEKYEIKRWDWDSPGNIKDLLTRLNAIRRKNPCLQMTRNIRFCQINNDQLLAYYKATGDYSNIIIVVVNLDSSHTQTGWLQIPIDELRIDKEASYVAHDLLSDQKYIWQGEGSYIELDPKRSPAHVIRINKQLHRKQDFDYFL